MQRGLSLFTRAAATMVVASTVAGCAATGSQSSEEVYDPLESVNRVIFDVNQQVDRFVIRPIAVAYRDVIPEPFRDRVTDFLRNARTPIIFANQVLQGDWEGAGDAAGRFFINSTIGLGGLIDIANYNDQGIPFENEDFGQTLAVWGVGEGPYLVVPLIGPSNVRDGVGFLVETLADPIGIVMAEFNHNEFNYTRLGLTIVDIRSRTVEATDELEASSVDYYAAIRSIYNRTRQAEILDGEVPDDSFEIPDFDEDLSDLDDFRAPTPGLVTEPGAPLPSPADDTRVTELPSDLQLQLMPLGQ